MIRAAAPWRIVAGFVLGLSAAPLLALAWDSAAEPAHARAGPADASAPAGRAQLRGPAAQGRPRPSPQAPGAGSASPSVSVPVSMPVSSSVPMPISRPESRPASPSPSDSASAPASTTAPEPEPSLAECRRRIAGSGPRIDHACLRRVYALPIAQWPVPRVDPGAVWTELAPLPAQAPHPPDNPPTPTKIALGRRLFEDPRLSRSGQIACANCHDRELGWGDGRSVPFGHDRQAGRRNAISVAMSGLAHSLFWDGRAGSLEAQALHPIADPREMAADPAAVLRRLRRDRSYRHDFAAAFGSPGVDERRLGQALAAFQRSLLPRANRFDRFLEGRRDLLDDRQLWGLHLFRTQARCMNCHSGAALDSPGFHNLGLHFYGRPLQDLGRYEVTGDPADAGKFKTPSLRGVSRTGPWMHNGRFARLRGVLNLYNAGMPRPKPSASQAADPWFPQPDPLLHRLDLHRSELDALAAYLDTL